MALRLKLLKSLGLQSLTEQSVTEQSLSEKLGMGRGRGRGRRSRIWAVRIWIEGSEYVI